MVPASPVQKSFCLSLPNVVINLQIFSLGLLFKWNDLFHLLLQELVMGMNEVTGGEMTETASVPSLYTHILVQFSCMVSNTLSKKRTQSGTDNKTTMHCYLFCI